MTLVSVTYQRLEFSPCVKTHNNHHAVSTAFNKQDIRAVIIIPNLPDRKLYVPVTVHF
jgi:hypothetical protein